MNLLHEFDTHLEVFLLEVHQGIRKMSLCKFNFLRPFFRLSLWYHLEVAEMLRIKKAYVL